MVTISDIKIGKDAPGGAEIDYYEADVVTAGDYYPFGMELPGRIYSATSQYRYGYQGSEKDKELNTNTYTTFFREIDTRIGRWWSVDQKSTAWESPYVIMSGNPLSFTDIRGDSIDPKRTKGYNVFIVSSSERREGDRADEADYKRIKKFQKHNPSNTILIESDDPKKALEDLQTKLGSDGYVKNMLIDYHAGTFGNKPLDDADVKSGLNTLSGGYIGQGSTVYLGQCWAGGNRPFDQGYTKNISTWADGATTYGGKTLAYSAGFVVRRDFAKMGWVYELEGSKGESDVELSGQRGVAFYSPQLKKVVSMDIKSRVYFTRDGSIVDKSKKGLDERYKLYQQKVVKKWMKIFTNFYNP